nr:hypothetical protein [Tanacetum cinerariifolium]
DPNENSSQSPPHIDHHCCYGYGDSLDGIFCQRCTCESCGNDAHIGYNCPPKVPIISNPEPCHNQNVDEFPQTLLRFHPTCYSGDGNSFDYDSTPHFVNDSPNIFNPPPQPPMYSYEFCGNDAHYSHNCPPQFEDLVPIPSESEGIPDNMCDVPFHDNSLPLDISKDKFEDFFDSNDDFISLLTTSIMLRHRLMILSVSLEESPSPFHILVEDSDSFFENFDTSLSYSDNSLPEFETFRDHTEETSSVSTTTHADNSLPKYDSFIFKIEPDQDELISVVMEDNLGQAHVHVPNMLPTHPTLMLDSDFIPSYNSLPESEIFCFDIKEKNSGSTTIHADISLPDIDHFHFKIEPDPGELTSIVNSGIRENVLSATNVNLPPRMANLLSLLMLYGSFFLFLHISLLLHIFSPHGMKIQFLTSASPIIVSLL